MSFHIRLRNIAFALSFLSAAACSDNEPDFESLTPQQIFAQADALLQDGSYEQAGDRFSEIERVYPYSDWARRGTVLAASAYNAAGEFEKSRIAAERFLSFYPGDEDAALAQFLVAMSYYELVGRQGRDRANAINALQFLNEVIEQYPESEYAKSAELKFDLVIDLLAAKEMEVGRYYLKRKHYSAAIRRVPGRCRRLQHDDACAGGFAQACRGLSFSGFGNSSQRSGLSPGLQLSRKRLVRGHLQAIRRQGSRAARRPRRDFGGILQANYSG